MPLSLIVMVLAVLSSLIRIARSDSLNLISVGETSSVIIRRQAFEMSSAGILLYGYRGHGSSGEAVVWLRSEIPYFEVKWSCFLSYNTSCFTGMFDFIDGFNF